MALPESLPTRDEDFPGYTEKVALENRIRGAACLGLDWEICGLPVKALTAYHVRLLMFARSPFFIAGIKVEQLADKPDVVNDIMRFLWVVSPLYRLGVKERAHWWQLKTAKDRFNAQYAGIMAQPWDKVCLEILEFIEQSYIDCEEFKGGSDKTFYAFEVAIAAEMREYGFRTDFWREVRVPKWKFWLPPVKDMNPMHVPLAIIFQFRKLRRFNKGEVVTNSSERLIADGLIKMNLDLKTQNPKRN